MCRYYVWTKTSYLKDYKITVAYIYAIFFPKRPGTMDYHGVNKLVTETYLWTAELVTKSTIFAQHTSIKRILS